MLCKLCLKDKQASDFYATNKSKCKECVKELAKAHRLANLEHYRAYDRMRASMPHRVAAREAYSKTKNYADRHRAATARWRQKHPEKRKAHIVLNNAIRSGKLVRQACAICGGKAEAHHPDYSQPLLVVWLCAKHHAEEHKAIKRERDSQCNCLATGN